MSLEYVAVELVSYMESVGKDEISESDVGLDTEEWVLDLVSNIESIEFFDEEIEMCDIEVEEAHCYFANGILTHNSAQELRAIANVTGEPGWVNTFLSGGDLHKNMAVSMWGAENYDKEKRKRAKVLNFGMSYGMSGYSLSQKFNVSVEEGEEIVAKFWKAAPRIKEYQTRCVKMARKNGTVYNYFGLPRRVKFYFDSPDPKKRAFGVRTVNNCYSPDTEFLTDKGWKIAYEISPETLIAMYVPERDVYEFVPAGERYSAKAEKAYRFKNNSTDLLVTGNHRMYVALGKSKEFGIVEAEKLYNKSGFSVINASKQGHVKFVETVRTPRGYWDIKDFAEFVGYLATDGTIGYDKRGNGAYVQIFNSKLAVVQRMRELNRRLGDVMHESSYEYQTTVKGIMYRFTISGKDFADFMVDFYQARLGVDKRLPEWFMELDCSVLKYTFDAALLGDGGSYSKNGLTFYGSSEEFAKQIQLIGMRLGYRSHMWNQGTKQGKELWRVEFTLNKNYSFCDKRYNYSVEEYENEIEFNCFSVPTGLLVVRRNGKIAVCGNTVIQSVGAGLLKLAMVKLWKFLGSDEYKDVIRFQCTVHDEINFAVRADRVEELAKLVRSCMRVEIPGWRVPFEIGTDIGTKWGATFPFKYNENDELVPDYEINEN